MDLQAIRATVIDIAQQAGAVLMRTLNQPHQEAFKSSYVDIVTEGDKASEAVILAALQQAFPTHHILTEESGNVGASASQAEYFWHIDPLDGTSNYAHNIPLFNVSIGMTDRHMKPLVGVVYHPVSGEVFSAAAGQGAFVGNQPIHVSARSTVRESMLCTGFPPMLDNPVDDNVAEWIAFSKHARGLRRLGAAALELAWVAAGRFDGYWEGRIHSWDCIAGILCVLEAGGQATDYNGTVSDLLYSGTEIVATNGHIHAEVLELLAESRRSRKSD